MNVMANITLDLARPGYVTVYGTQGDRLTRKITATLTANGTAWTPPAGTLAVIYYTKPDGTQGFYDTDENGDSAYTISSNTITFVMAAQALAVPGNVAVNVRLYNASEEILTSFAFVMTVMPGVPDEEIESSDYYNVMEQTLAGMAQAVEDFHDAMEAGYGAPLVASTVAGMTDHTKVYVYVGSETGYVNGDWYYWDGTQWADGGVYNSAAIDLDTTLTSTTKPAQGKAVGDALALKQNTLTFDNAPASGSNNPVKSGGIYTALQGKQDTLTIDSTPTEASTNPVESGGVYDELSELKSDLNLIANFSGYNLLEDKAITAKWFVDPGTGVGRALNDFFSVLSVDVSSLKARKVFIYSSVTYASVNTCRCVSFYNDDDEFITGYGGSSNLANNGYPVPDTAATMSVTFLYGSGTTMPETYWASDNAQNVVSGKIKSDAIPTMYTNNMRKGCINFQFDDGTSNDANIVNIFDSFGYTCGFALISTISESDTIRYLGYQNKGYEILCHADSSTGMNDPTVSPEIIEGRLASSKTTLENAGFTINGFVTPSSNMANVFRPILRKYYQWAETIYYGIYNGTGQPYMMPHDGIYNGWRVSLQSTTLANQKAAVDEAIANYGCLTFYGHPADMDGSDNFTTANLTELLTYIQTKVGNGECVIGNPSDVIRNYFDVRNDDILNEWVNVTSTDAELNANFTTTEWEMSYNEVLKLLTFAIRVKPTQDVTGPINPLLIFPKSIDGDYLIQNETGRNCLVYNGGLLVQGSNTWTQGTNYRFSGMLKLI